MANTFTQNARVYACCQASSIFRPRLARNWPKQQRGKSTAARMFLRPVAAPGAPDDFRCEDDFTVRQRYALLTVTEACERLRISRWMLYSLIHKQQIKTIKIGSRRLIPATALHELINRLSDQEAA